MGIPEAKPAKLHSFFHHQTRRQRRWVLGCHFAMAIVKNTAVSITLQSRVGKGSTSPVRSVDGRQAQV